MIVIYGDTNCAWCDRAKKLCEAYLLDFEYKLIRDPGVMDELQERVANTRTVPQIFWNDKHVGGFEELVTEIEDTQNFGQESI